MRTHVWLVALVISLVPGCFSEHFVAPAPEVDFIAHTRSGSSFRIVTPPRVSDAATEICSEGACVRGLRRQMESGLAQTLGTLAQPARDAADADYLGTLTSVSFTAHPIWNRASLESVDLSLSWRFVLRDRRTNQDVVRLQGTEHGAAPRGAGLVEQLRALEHDALARIEQAVARSALTAPVGH